MAEIELFQDAGQAEIEVFFDESGQVVIRKLAGAEGLYLHAHRPGKAQGITEMYLAFVGQACGHHIFGGVAGGIDADAVDAQRVFAA